MSKEPEHSLLPWSIEHKPGKRSTGYVEPDAEPYDLATVTIVSARETDAKRYNPATTKYDIPVREMVAQMVFDDRQKGAASRRLADFRFAVRAVNSHDALLSAAKKAANELAVMLELNPARDGGLYREALDGLNAAIALADKDS